MTIEILSENTSLLMVSHQIIPSPVILIKELIENSIDSDANTIKISIQGDNSSLVYLVSDNGTGIEVNEYFLLPGGTSKKNKNTYGYRGMSLSAISQLSEIQITTRTKEGISTETIATATERTTKESYRPERGTRVKVSNLHKKTPVRDEYNQKNINQYIKEILILSKKYSLLHGITISIEKNNKELFNSKGNIRYLQRTNRIFHLYHPQKVLGIYKITTDSFILRAVFSREIPAAEGIIEIDSKLVENTKISHVLTQIAKALNTRITYILQITEIHPDTLTNTTNTIRNNRRLIYREPYVIGLLESIRYRPEISQLSNASEISLTILQLPLTKVQVPYTTEIYHTIEYNQIQVPVEHSTIPQDNNTNTQKKRIYSETQLQRGNTTQKEEVSSSMHPFIIDQKENLLAPEETQGITISQNDLSKLELIGQFNNGFIIAALKKGTNTYLYAIDQHAADEAVNYERLKNTYTPRRQRLIKPLPINLSEHEHYLAEEYKDKLKSNGFILSEDTKYLLEAPLCSSQLFTEPELKESINELKDQTTNKPILFTALRKHLATKACRTSIMIGDPLNIQQMKQILNNLSTTTRPWNCPHGRPTIVLLRNISTDN
ncbi:DNA mismatch repair protein PMS2 [Nematocida sp. AWRm80]|nr:DNA mismatch repair protein PMS2 [Nematocida sp. AWRm80]